MSRRLPEVRFLARLGRAIPDAIFAAVFLVFLAKIVLRYAAHEEPAWSDEICVILFIWMIFCANAFVLSDRQQISFDLLYRPMPAMIRRGMAAARLLLVGADLCRRPADHRRLHPVPAPRTHAGAAMAAGPGVFLLRHLRAGRGPARTGGACASAGPQLAKRDLMGHGIAVLFGVFGAAALLGAPLGLSMLSAGFAYMMATHQDLGLVVDQTMNGLYNSYLLIAVPLFIFVANIMNASGVIDRLLKFGSAMVGHLPGGLAHVNVVSNLIFSGMSGSAVADASGPGLIMARMMTENGRYPAGFAAATSVAAATIGPLMPTSIPMIFYALIANVSVGAMLLGGLVPALMMAAALMAAIAIVARHRGFPREAALPWTAVPAIILRALLPLALPGILLGIIYSGVATPTEAAAIAAFYALALAVLIYRSLTWASLRHAISETVRNTAMITIIMAGAFVFNYAIANENLPQAIRDAFLSWNLSPLGFLLCANALMLVLAIFLDEVTILLVIVPLLVPIAQSLGVDLVHFGVVVVLNMMVGLTLPPHGLLLFVMHGLTGTPLGAIFREIPPFTVALVAVVLLVTFVPALVETLPRLAGMAN